MAPLRFTFDGEAISARPGDSIAAALETAGRRTLGRRMSGAARGLYCGMGACRDCLVTVDGARSVRACMSEVRDGMTVVTQDDRAPLPGSGASARPATQIEVDLFVVGAGPAGLEAAIAAADAGLTVRVADERSDPGGQYYKPPSEVAGSTRRDRQHREGDALRARFAACDAILDAGANVWFARAADDGFVLRYTHDGHETEAMARTVVLATGAHERPAAVPGWTEPGVMTIGAAQTLARRYGIAPGRSILVAGHGPLGLQLGVELLALGATVVGVAERGRMAMAGLARTLVSDARLGLTGAGYLARLVRAGVPVWRDTEVTQIGDADDDGLRDVALRRIAGSGDRTVRADTICMSDGFLPQFELARLLGCRVERDGTALARLARDPIGGTDVAGLWIVGDGGGLGGAQVALAQGRLAGRAAARHVGRNAPTDATAVASLARARRFQAALWSAFDVPPRPPPEGETIVCRCEGVTAAQVREAIVDGADDPGAVKRATRCGMGRCQGRFCTSTLLSMLERSGAKVVPESLMAPQVPTRPVRAGILAHEKPEWGGHREAPPSARPHPAASEPLPVRDFDVAVIGGGVTGLAAALHAAREGASVALLDRGYAAAEASGGNAGSLHLQLLSWDFGQKAVAGGGPALRTLTLQAESIDLWSQLQSELGADFGMKVTGGLMLAENPDQIAFLEAKAKAEAGAGVETHFIGADDIRRIAPAVSDIFVAAAWCPGEGKIDPLSANRALLAAVRVAGVTIAELTPVRAIAADGDGYTLHTSRGKMRAGRIVIAAGGWSAELGAMLGVPLPVRGAPLQMVVTEPAPPLVDCLIAHADRHLTLKQVAAGSILIGGAWPSRVNARGQPEVLPDSLEGNLWVACRTIPAIAGLDVIRSWGAMNIDIDGAPLLSHLPGHPRIVVAATANGYTLGPLMGREAAAGVLSGRMRRDLSEFDLDRFQLTTEKDIS